MSSENSEDFTAGIKLNAGEPEVSGAAATHSQGSLTTWEDLAKGGVSREDIFDQYKKYFGERPKQVYLNEGICVRYGNYCYNYYRDAQFYNKRSKQMQSVANSRTISNALDHDVTHEVTLSASKEKSATVTVTKESEFSFGFSISVGSESLGIGSEFSQDFTFRNSVGSNSSFKEDVMVEDKTTITLKPKEKVVVDLDLQWISFKEDFKIPFYIKGWTGADFGHKVEGHHYWFMMLGGLLKPANLEGTCVTAYEIRGNVDIRPAP